MAQFGAAHDGEEDPSVCYRHPDRQSWVLCQRCGRTICPECQIPAAVGVQCPECVREAGGSVPRSSGRGPARVTPIRAARSSRQRPRWAQTLLGMLRPGSGTPVLSWGTVAIVLVLWIVGFFTASLPWVVLSAIPDVSWQVWRFFTAPFAYPSAFDLQFVLFLALNLVFFLLTAPAVELTLGRRRFITVFLASAAVGSAGMILAGSVGYGIGGVLFGLFGAYLVLVWDNPMARTQVLITLGINIVINLVLGGYSLPMIVGGVAGGVGSMFALRHFESRARAKASTPYLVVAAGVAAFIVLAILRSIVLF